MKNKHIWVLTVSVMFAISLFAGIQWAVTAQAQPRNGDQLPANPPNDPSSPNAPAACLITGTKEGVDVSVFQGKITWTAVAAAGKSFAYARAADGATYTDSTFITNFRNVSSVLRQNGHRV